MATDCQVTRAFAILEQLFRHPTHGMTNQEIVAATGYTSVQVCRDLQKLAALNIVEVWDKGWCPHARLLGWATAFERQMTEGKQRIDERENHVAAYAARTRG